MLDDVEREGIGEIIDRLISVPVYTGSTLARRPVLLDLHDAARAKFDGPLTYLTEETIRKAAQKGKTAIIMAENDRR